MNLLAERPVGLHRPMIARARVQVAGAVLLVCVIPYLVRLAFNTTGRTDDAALATLIANLVAVGSGFWLLRSLAIFPGAKDSYFVTPAFSATFGLVLAVLVFARIDYSRALLLSGYAITLIWFVSMSVLAGRGRRLQLGLLPFGDVESAMSVPNVNWHPLLTVADPRDGLDAIVADFRAELPPEWERMLSDCALDGMVVYHTKQLREALTGRVEVEHLSENNFGSLVPLAAYLRVKTVVDWLAALVCLPLVVPALLAIGLIVRLESPGPAIFRQQRVGYRGRPFVVYKVRTMRQVDEWPSDQRGTAITSDRDPRVTRFGRFLRRTRMDELPQVLNILRGEMSWIGPRPEAVALSTWYERELPFYRYRHVVRPGISGWAQVNQGHVAQIDEVREKLQNDFYYIKYFSPWLDILIAIRTVGTVLTGFGSR